VLGLGLSRGWLFRSCEAVGGFLGVVSLIQHNHPPNLLPPETGFYLISPLELIPLPVCLCVCVCDWGCESECVYPPLSVFVQNKDKSLRFR